MDVLLVGGELPKTLPELPARIWGGRCRVGERVLEDGMEVPFESHEQAVLELVLATGQLVVSGNGLRVAAAGGARYLEDLPEDMWSP